MSRRKRSHVTMTLFPFLAVLICTVGALIVVLVVLMQKAQQPDESPVASSVQTIVRVAQPTVSDPDAERMVAELDQSAARLTENIEGFRWASETLLTSREKTSNRLNDMRQQLARWEDQTRDLDQQLELLEKQSQDLLDTEAHKLVPSDNAAAKLAELRLEIDRKKEELEAVRATAEKRRRQYALIPYEGPFGTKRRPIYIECLAERVIIQPHGIEFGAEDFVDAGPRNPLASALRAAREYLSDAGLTETIGEPYPLLIVRPEGAHSFSACRTALRSWDNEFGYELVPDDIELTYPPVDAALTQLLSESVYESRAMAGIQPPHGPGSGPRFVAATNSAATESSANPSGGSHQPADHSHLSYPGNMHSSTTESAATERPADAAGFGFGQNGVGGSNGMVGSAVGGVGHGGVGHGRATAIGTSEFAGVSSFPAARDSRSTGAVAGSSDMKLGFGTQGGMFSHQGASVTEHASGSGTGQPVDPTNQPGGANGRGNAANPGSLVDHTRHSPSTGNSQQLGSRDILPFPGSGADTLPGDSLSSGWAQPSGNRGSSAISGSANSATGSERGTSAAGGSAGGTAGNVGLGRSMGSAATSQSGASAPSSPGASPSGETANSPSMSFSNLSEPDLNQPERSSQKSLAATQGSNWALPNAADGSIGISRPIQINCGRQGIKIRSETGDKRPITIPFESGVREAIQPFVANVWTQIDAWGIAGPGVYWKPVLHVSVEQDAESEFAEMAAVLEGSGLEIQRR